MGTIWHQSGVNQNGEPFVQLLVDAKVVGQFTPAECRDHARTILEAAEAAEQDAFMLSFFQKNLAMPLEQVWPIIIQFREWREAQGKKGPPSRKSEFMVTDKHVKPPGEEKK